MAEKPGLPRNVWVTGWVSFCMDVSSEMVYPLVPLFLSSVLGVNKSVIGLIEGVAEATASILKLFSGALADRFGKNKLLMGLGYGVSTGSRAILATAGGWGDVFGSRFVDRVGKGIRTAPRDAIVAASTPTEIMGKAFGLHRTLDTLGAVLGPALAMLVLFFYAGDYRLVFWLSIIPGILAVLLIVLFITADGPVPSERRSFIWSAKEFDGRFWSFILVVGLFSLGNSSDAFLILRAENAGVSPVWVPGVYLGFHVVYALVAVPGGMLADRFGKRRFILLGFVLFSAVYAGFALASSPWQVAGLFALYGVYMGLTDGVQRAYLATIIPPERRATGYGIYHTVVGLAILPASLAAGLLWDHVGPAAPFWYGAVFSAAAGLLFLVLILKKQLAVRP